MNRRHSLCLSLCALLPLLAACDNTPLTAPLSDSAIAAVADDAGAPTRQVARQIDDLFTARDAGETRAAILVYDGNIVAERYGEGYDAETRLIGWSMAKTITAAMIGQLIAEGRLEVDAPAPVPRWQRPGDPRGEITLRHLLQMRSGLRHTEMVEPVYEALMTRMLLLDGRDDMADFASSQPLEAEPGAKFKYSTATTIILSDIAARSLAPEGDAEKRRTAVANFLESRFFGPLKMASAVPEFDAAGTFIGSSLVHATARDWAKFGEMLRLGGLAPDGTRVLPEQWVEAMITPSPQSPQYGLQTWLNRDHGEDRHPLFPDRAPSTMFAMIGHMGQYVLVSPSQRLTLVRLGHTNPEDRQVLLQNLADILELYPER